MHDHEELTPSERELESALGKLRPSGHAIDRDGLMFAAGLGSGRRTRHRWQAATGLMTALLIASWTIRPPTPTAPMVAGAPGEDVPAVAKTALPDLPPIPPMRHTLASAPPEILHPLPPYLNLLNRVVAEGPDALVGLGAAVASVPHAGSGHDIHHRQEPTQYRAFGPDRDIGG